MNLDAFECPICLSVFQGSIFQCKNGHVVCDACLVHIRGICPSCREPVGEIRNRRMEDAIAGLVVPCAFSSHGCTQLLKLTEMRDHEAFCQHAPFACAFPACAYSAASVPLLVDHILDAHAPFACPFPACAYSAASAPLLHDHILDAHALDKESSIDLDGSTWSVSLHRSRRFKVLLDPLKRRVFLLLHGLLLHGGDVRSGRSLSVVCLGPRPAANKSLEFKLEVGGARKPGALSLSATGSVPCMRSWAGRYSTDEFLFVPDAYYNSWNCVRVNVHVHAQDSISS